MLKIDKNGNLQWQKTFGGSNSDAFSDVTLSKEGNLIFAGVSNSTNGDVTGAHGLEDVWIVRTDLKGKTIWQKTFGGTAFDQAHAIYPTLDGGFLIAAVTTSNNGDVSGNHGFLDGWVLKIDGKGRKQWQKTTGGTGYDMLTSVVSKWDGSCAVAGWTEGIDGDVKGNHGRADGWVMTLKK